MSDGCGHAADDASCKCWGVRVRNADRAEAWAYFAIGGPDERGNYERAYGVACQLRTQYPDTSYRVERREVLGEQVVKTAAPLKPIERCGHAETDPHCFCYGVHYEVDRAYNGGATLTWCEGFAWMDVLAGRRGANLYWARKVVVHHIDQKARAVAIEPEKRSADEHVYAGNIYEIRRYDKATASPTTICNDCKAAPCDCGKRIWSWVFRSAAHPNGAWLGGHPLDETPPNGRERRHAVHLATSASYAERGPIQRITEPPYQFPTPVASRQPVLTGTLSDKVTIHAPSHKCSLPWCTALTTDRFCGPRCQDFGARLHCIEGRRASFEFKIVKGKARHGHAELAFAKEQTETDIVALERAWHAVQHEAAQGDERFFALLYDEGWS